MLDSRRTHGNEREDFAESFLALGPAAPTILPGWDAAALLEHLHLRERAPFLMPAHRLPGPLAGRARAALERYWRAPWEERVAGFRAAPGPLSPIGRLDALSGQSELLIHHEDLRRAQDGWEPRRIPAERSQDAWRAVGLIAPLAMSVHADITLISPLGGRRLRGRRSAGSLRVHGEPLELLLWVSGRDQVARVQVHGEPAALRALQDGRRGL